MCRVLKNKSIQIKTPISKRNFICKKLILGPNGQLEDSLMRDFKKYMQNENERRHFTRKIRSEIHSFLSLDIVGLKEEVKLLEDHLISLAGTLKNQPSKAANIIIKAEGVGALVCFGALIGPRLPQSIRLDFELDSAPLALIPTKFCRKLASAPKTDWSLILTHSKRPEFNDWPRLTRPSILHPFLKSAESIEKKTIYRGGLPLAS